MQEMFWKIAKAISGFTASAYMKDVVVKPNRVAQLARAFANRMGKPLLNIGAGTPNSSLRVILFGPTLWGDVNIDIAAPKNIVHGPGRVSWGDAHDLSQWPDKFFGAIIASHVLEHVERPDICLKEWHRVAEKVFVVVPPWWAPHTWAHPGHVWFIDPDLKVAKPLWTQRMRNLPLPTKTVVRSNGWGPNAPLVSAPAVQPGGVPMDSSSSRLDRMFQDKSQQSSATAMSQEQAEPQQYAALVHGLNSTRRVKP